MPDSARAQVLDTLAEVVTSLRVQHPTRVAVEGRSAAGKTTFADDLAEVIRLRGREVIRSSIDDFHPPGYKFRSQRGEWTPRSYYDEGYDYAAFRDLLLRPLGPGAIVGAARPSSIPSTMNGCLKSGTRWAPARSRSSTAPFSFIRISPITGSM